MLVKLSGVEHDLFHLACMFSMCICMYEKCGHMLRLHVMACSSLNQTKVYTGTNQKVRQSYRSGTGWELATLLGSTRISQCIHMVWTWMILTKANTLLLLKKVGSCSKDCTLIDRSPGKAHELACWATYVEPCGQHHRSQFNCVSLNKAMQFVSPQHGWCRQG